MKYVITIITAVILAACTGDAATRATTALGVACDTYGTVLKELVPLRRAGKLKSSLIKRVDTLNLQVDLACLPSSTLDPAVGVRTVERAIGMINGIREAL